MRKLIEDKVHAIISNMDSNEQLEYLEYNWPLMSDKDLLALYMTLIGYHN